MRRQQFARPQYPPIPSEGQSGSGLHNQYNGLPVAYPTPPSHPGHLSASIATASAYYNSSSNISPIMASPNRTSSSPSTTFSSSSPPSRRSFPSEPPHPHYQSTNHHSIMSRSHHPSPSIASSPSLTTPSHHNQHHFHGGNQQHQMRHLKENNSAGLPMWASEKMQYGTNSKCGFCRNLLFLIIILIAVCSISATILYMTDNMQHLATAVEYYHITKESAYPMSIRVKGTALHVLELILDKSLHASKAMAEYVGSKISKFRDVGETVIETTS